MEYQDADARWACLRRHHSKGGWSNRLPAVTWQRGLPGSKAPRRRRSLVRVPGMGGRSQRMAIRKSLARRNNRRIFDQAAILACRRPLAGPAVPIRGHYTKVMCGLSIARKRDARAGFTATLAAVLGHAAPHHLGSAILPRGSPPSGAAAAPHWGLREVFANTFFESSYWPLYDIPEPQIDRQAAQKL